MVKRIKTGVNGFDKLVEGGVPEGYAVLLTGSPGTGKTIFGLEFLVRGAFEFSEPGLFITFEETHENLLMQAEEVGLDIKPLVRKSLVVVKTLPSEENLNESMVFKLIDDAVNEYGIKRLVIDSLNTYANNIASYEDREHVLSDEGLIRRIVYRLIKRLQQFPQLTKFLISEGDEAGERLSLDGVSEFLCDGVILIKYTTMGGPYSRQMKVRKMRSTHNNPDLFALEIGKKGVIIRSNERHG